MKLFAIGDLHLSFGVAGKEMDVFDPIWKNHAEKIKTNWEARVSEEDLVLIPGDLSWALKPTEALPDLEFVDSLPGTKVIIKGNHDYWWGSLKKVRELLPPSIFAIQNDTFNFKGVSVCGARLWDTNEYCFNAHIDFKENPLSKPSTIDLEKEQAIFERELHRLELSLKALDPNALIKVAMTHYPPIGSDFAPSKASLLMEKYGVDICVFGHLHSLKKSFEFEGKAGGISYHLTSCDYLHFNPLLIKVL